MAKKLRKNLAVTIDGDKEFRKANEAVSLRVSHGKLSLLSRKIFNAMVYHAQQMGVPGVNSPVDTESAKKYFWIPFGDLVRDASYQSNDTILVKEHIDELQNIRIHLEDETQWTSERLIAGAKLYSAGGLKKKGSKLWFGYTFPPEVSTLVMNPARYTKLSLYYQTMLRSGCSLALYEVCRSYASNPSHLTMRNEWGWWFGVLTGVPVGTGLPEYKYFKRDSLKTAIREINAVTDIDVELIEHKNGKRVVDLQFRVHQKPQQQFDLPVPPIVNGELIERLRGIGLAKEEAITLSVSEEEGFLKATVDLVEKRLRSRNVPPVESPAAYFRSALKGRFALAKETTPQSKLPAPKKEQGSLREEFEKQRRLDAWKHYDDLPGESQEKAMAEFSKNAAPVIRNALKKSGMRSQLAKMSFCGWLALTLWGEPTDSDILKFAEDGRAAKH